MGLRLNRLLSRDPLALDPGQFMRHVETVICCPLCGKNTPLDPAKHVVSRSGEVTPAWRCPYCPLVEWLTLADHDEEVVP